MTVLASTRHPLYDGLSSTYSEALKLPDDGFHYELVQGVLCVTPSPSFSHQQLIGELHGLLYLYLKKNPAGIVTLAPRDVKLAEDLVYIPDLLYIAQDRLSINTPQYVDGAPDWVVEVLSPATMARDIRDKFLDYQRYGVKEYWILHPTEIDTCQFYWLEQGKYQAFYPENGTISAKVLPGFRVDLADLLKQMGT